MTRPVDKHRVDHIQMYHIPTACTFYAKKSKNHIVKLMIVSIQKYRIILEEFL